MEFNKYFCFSTLIICFFVSAHAFAQTTKLFKQNKLINGLPIIPVGLDSYKMWDKWPLQRLGVRAYMRSTFDRKGGNEGADASHFLFANEENNNVTLDIKGKGVLYFFRANHWHGSPWHFIIDNKDNIVKETGTDDSIKNTKIIKNSDFIPSKPFPKPLNWTWSTTNGADLIRTPMPFEKSLRIAYSKTHYGTGYYIYDLYANNENLSRPIHSWNMNTNPDKKVLDLLSMAGTDIAPKNIKTNHGKLILNKERSVIIDLKTSSPSMVRAFKLIIPLYQAPELERVHLLVTWDGAKYPSINAPICLFFGAGTLYNRDKKEYFVKGFPINIRYDYLNNKIELACYYPMPFFKSAKFELAGINTEGIEINYEIRYMPLDMAPNQSSYFHATYVDIPNPTLGKDLIYLDTQGIEGHNEWSGSFVGNSFIFSQNANLGTLEGDPRFFFDDSQSPQAYGTGTEEWGGGGDYWGGINMTLPFVGHPCGVAKKSEAKNEKDLIESAYRFLLADMMPFGRRAIIGFEHGGEDLSTEHYEGVSYWYGLPAPSLIKTDEFDVGKKSSEKEHKYYSPQASKIQTIISRYPLGIDTFPIKTWGLNPNKIPGYAEKEGTEVYTTHEEDGRYTKGVSEFTIKLDRENKGALLRRTLDYSFPNQTAKIYIEDNIRKDNASNAKWKYVGTWYTAGSNTSLYSNPKGESDKRQLVVQTSDRRFRDDEFLLPARLTEGCSKVRIRIKFIADNQKLFPGFPFPKESAWSELRYEVYSYILPNFKK